MGKQQNLGSKEERESKEETEKERSAAERRTGRVESEEKNVSSNTWRELR